MGLTAHFIQFAAYNAWANRQVYAAAGELSEEEFHRPVGAFFGSLHRTLNHLLVADRIWMKRFTGTGEAPDRLDAILAETRTELEALRSAEDARIRDWVAGLSEKDLAGDIQYRPVSSPEPVTQPLAGALAHVFNHQTHHRGQCHMILTVLGQPSLTLDLAFFQRTPEGRAATQGVAFT